MKINNQDVNIDDLFNQKIDINDLINEKYMHKEIKKGIFLSDYQIEVLLKYGINPNACGTLNDLIYQIDEVLDEEDEDDLDQISKEINEYNYYHNTNK